MSENPYGTPPQEPYQPGGGQPGGYPPPYQQPSQPGYGTPAPQYGSPQYGAPQYGAPQAGGPGGVKPGNNLVLAILATLFCCLPGGIYAIVQAAKVDGLWSQGNFAAAAKAAADARKWSIISAAVGLPLNILLIVVQAMGGSN
mgnify:CR=1 FL=1